MKRETTPHQAPTAAHPFGTKTGAEPRRTPQRSRYVDEGGRLDSKNGRERRGRADTMCCVHPPSHRRWSWKGDVREVVENREGQKPHTRGHSNRRRADRIRGMGQRRDRSRFGLCRRQVTRPERRRKRRRTQDDETRGDEFRKHGYKCCKSP